LEGLDDVQRRYRIDEDRVSVRGFSMGGAACWQFAVHYPDRWFAANPGAGFSETPEFLKFFQKEILHPSPWEKALWNMYDCNQYAGNLAHCPTIAYSGEKDIQKQAADIMETALRERHIRLKHVIGANMGHSIDGTSMVIIEDSMASLAKIGRNTNPKRLQFETSTLKYNRMHWLTVDSLIEHWKPASVSVEPLGRDT
ncbi:MAG: prolyl oligopeptidase family serine peptidase, partial [Fuerstiella sp.]|nr:prolyl oligopeptidase family serine peptidase [Fuerstiella sp.]